MGIQQIDHLSKKKPVFAFTLEKSD